jgi:hypothetical protein
MKRPFVSLFLIISLAMAVHSVPNTKNMGFRQYLNWDNGAVHLSAVSRDPYRNQSIPLFKGITNLSSAFTLLRDLQYSGLRNDGLLSIPLFIGLSSSDLKSSGDLSLAKRKGDVLYGIADQYTGEQIILSKVTITPIVDSIIYFQLGTEYFRRNYDVIDSRWFGFVSDLVLDKNNAYVSGTDNSAKLNQLLQYSGKLKISKGNYFFNSNGFKLKSNTTLDLSDSVLKYKSTSIYASFLILGGESFLSENINLLNGTLLGNKNELTTVTEWMHGIIVNEAKNIRIENIASNLNRGDGLYIGMDNEKEENRSQFIEVVNCVFDQNHRQGCSVVSGQNITFTSTKFINTRGTAPQSGVDIEPNPHRSEFRDLCKNIIFNTCEFSGNASTGACIYGVLNNGTNTEDISNIEFNACIFSKNLATGIDFRACTTVKIDNCIVNAVENGILFSDAIYKNITITNTKVFGNKSGIGIYIIANTTGLISEDIKIDHCEISNFGRYGFLVEEKSTTFLKGFVFTNNTIHHNFNNIHIQKGVINAVYSGNTSTKVGVDVDNIRYPGWTFGWEFSKGDDAASRKDYDIKGNLKGN